MSSEDAAQHLQDIRAMMLCARRYSEVRAGWFLMVWGLIWIVGFMAGQFIPEVASVIWIILNASGIVASVLMSAFLYGRKSSRRVPGLPRKIALLAVSMVVFEVLAAWLLSLSSPREITLIVVLSSALCYVVAGLISQIRLLVPGAFLAASVVAGHLLVPDFFYLTVAVLGGGALVVTGLLSLRHHE